MRVDTIIEDEEFGHCYIRCNARAVRYTFRPACDGSAQCGILITVPPFYLLTSVAQSIDLMRPKLRILIRKAQEQQGDQHQSSVEQKAEHRRNIEQMRMQAKRDLPPKLLALAQQFGFEVKDVKITSARTRWGSCVARKRGVWGRKEYTVNLSLYCILLPERLQRLVMLHELTHIHHMDHSAAFHAELNAMLDGQEKNLEKELKQFKI